MNYRDYVVGAYAVFVIVLLWDFVAPRVRIAQLLRARKRMAAHRDAAASQPSGELRR